MQSQPSSTAGKATGPGQAGTLSLVSGLHPAQGPGTKGVPHSVPPGGLAQSSAARAVPRSLFSDLPVSPSLLENPLPSC